MQKLEFKNGLLYTSLIITHQNKTTKVNNIIVDTGAFHTILSPTIIDDMEINFSNDDELIQAYGLGGNLCSSIRKRIDNISCGDIELQNIKIDFGEIDPKERINGLLGLDFLKNSEVIIDLVDLVMYKKTND